MFIAAQFLLSRRIAGHHDLKTEPWSEPRPARASTQIFPPLCSTIFLQIARPIPLPGYSVRAWRRWKTTKIFSAYSGAMPIPLPLTLNNHCWPAFSACTEIAGGSFPRKLDRVPDQILDTTFGLVPEQNPLPPLLTYRLFRITTLAWVEVPCA